MHLFLQFQCSRCPVAIILGTIFVNVPLYVCNLFCMFLLFVFMFLYMCICLHIYFECVFFVCNFEYFCIHNLNCLACICILIILQVRCICILHFNAIILCFVCFLNSYVDVFNITKVLCFCYFIFIVFFFTVCEVGHLGLVHLSSQQIQVLSRP